MKTYLFSVLAIMIRLSALDFQAGSDGIFIANIIKIILLSRRVYLDLALGDAFDQPVSVVYHCSLASH
jgi:hypothetical protein